ncbi:MAG: glycosyltransferase [Tannerellaceae bacterium]
MEPTIFTANWSMILLISATVLLCIQLAYYIFIYAKPFQLIKQSNLSKLEYNDALPPVSVIIYALNDSENLRENLPKILEQEYPNFEVIVINDGSTDETEEVLKLYSVNFSNLYHTYIPEESRYLSRRKLAMTVGIKAAKHDYLLFTDSASAPVSPLWIERMMRNFTPETDFVLGFSGYHKAKGFLASLASFDNLLTMVHYLARAIAKRPYAGLGRNLAYRKSVFFNNKGFSKHLDLHFGEDNLFVNDNATKTNTRVEVSPESIIQSETPYNTSIWKEIKLRLAGTACHYKGMSPTLFGLETFTRFLFFVNIILLIIVSNLNWIVIVEAICLLLIRWTVRCIQISKLQSLFLQKKTTALTLLLDCINPICNLYFKLNRKVSFKNDYTWRLPK